MVSLLPQASMSFGGKAGNACFMSLSSIGHIDPQTNKGSAKALTDLIESSLGIPKERIFIQFFDAAPSDFAWKGNTFG